MSSSSKEKNESKTNIIQMWSMTKHTQMAKHGPRVGPESLKDWSITDSLWNWRAAVSKSRWNTTGKRKCSPLDVGYCFHGCGCWLNTQRTPKGVYFIEALLTTCWTLNTENTSSSADVGTQWNFNFLALSHQLSHGVSALWLFSTKSI